MNLSESCVPVTVSSTDVAVATNSPEKPRRNLTQAFDALCAAEPGCGTINETYSDEPNVLSPTFSAGVVSKGKASLVSPTNVADFGFPEATPDVSASNDSVIPELNLHEDLRRELSVFCVRRVSCYSLIHDINKECSAMAQHDPLAMLAGEKESPLVMSALLGCTNFSVTYSAQDPSKVADAVIDEEQWLLVSISSRTAHETHLTANADCPSTFLQAMGEKEYENPVVSVTGHSRTQLWKPSRSWWEAKSGKNPWIEPASHNKRWRYLWPLIHYHKFLAKCIKKLKRNGVDVKLSVSPVSVFLREEVCAVSDHLAAVSLFDSDEWMDCLSHFDGWTVVTASAEQQYRDYVRQLPLRSLAEPGDVDSPILRSQIDENFLRAIAAQREQFRETATTATAATTNQVTTKASSSDRPPIQRLLPDSATAARTGHHHPTYQRESPAQSTSVPRQIHGVRRPRYFPQNGAWYGWEGQPFHDNSSVHSELSANSFPQQTHRYDFNGNAPGMYPMVGSGHVPPGYYPPVGAYPGSAEQSQSSDGYAYHGYNDTSGWIDPYMTAAYAMQQHQSMEGYYRHPLPVSPPVSSTPTVYSEIQTDKTVMHTDTANPIPSERNHGALSDPMATPFKYDPDNSFTHSPYWSHLDQATIAMGLATPAKPPTPMTPPRGDDKRDDELDKEASSFHVEPAFHATAQAPLLRQHYYSHGNYHRAGSVGGMNHECYVPPSPATQFMMSPHAHPNPSFPYNYGYGFSPRRPVRTMTTPRHLANKSIPEKAAMSTPRDCESLAPVPMQRPSASTVDITTDSASAV